MMFRIYKAQARGLSTSRGGSSASLKRKSLRWIDARSAGVLKFSCTQCGRCCSGPSGQVRLTREEAKSIAAKLELREDEFMKYYTEELEGQLILREKETTFGMDCVLLQRPDNTKKVHCAAYEARPFQCKTFPWWLENVESPKAWRRVQRVCEGAGQGAEVQSDTIRAIVSQQLEHECGGA